MMSSINKELDWASLSCLSGVNSLDTGELDLVDLASTNLGACKSVESMLWLRSSLPLVIVPSLMKVIIKSEKISVCDSII